MVNAFDELRQRIDKKERELLSNADTYLERNLIEMDSYMRLIGGRCLTLNQTSEQLAVTVKQSDEVQLLSYFSSQFFKIRDSTLESDIP